MARSERCADFDHRGKCGTCCTLSNFALETFSLNKEVNDTNSHPGLITKYQASGAQGYYGAISGLLDLGSALYGEKLLSGKAYGRSLQFAFIYPVLALIMGWLFFDVGVLGGAEFLPEGKHWLERLWRSAILVFSFAIAANSIKFSEFIEVRLKKKLTNHLACNVQGTGFLSKRFPPTPNLLGLIAVTVAVAFALTIAVAFAGVVAGAFVGAFAVAGAFAIVGPIAFSFAVAVAVAITGALAVAFAGDTTLSATILLFFLVLPWLNAVADMVSVAATRRFLGYIRDKKPGFFWVFIDILLDLAVAAFCLLFLLGALWGVLSLWGHFSPNTLAFDWRAYAIAVWQGDWQKGAALILMVATTLIPTLLHVILGLAGFWAQESRGYRRAVAALVAHKGKKLPVITANQIIRNIRCGIFLGWFKALVAVSIGCYVIWMAYRLIAG